MAVITKTRVGKNVRPRWSDIVEISFGPKPVSTIRAYGSGAWIRRFSRRETIWLVRSGVNVQEFSLQRRVDAFMVTVHCRNQAITLKSPSTSLFPIMWPIASVLIIALQQLQN